MSDHHHNQTVPTGALIGAAVVMMASLALAAGARHQYLSQPPAVVQPAREAYDVRFEDRPDGSLAVIDAPTGREVHSVPAGTNGFIRGVLRGMFRGRKLESVGHEGAFRLAAEFDGKLTLTDPYTGRRVDLDSFGPTNSASFRELLAAEAGAAR